MKKNSFETILYSVAGVAILLVILILFNALTATVRLRADLTQEKAYTLSDGTKSILGRIPSDQPIKIRFYFSSAEAGSPETVMLKNYAQHVQDLLAEYKQAGHGRIILEQYDPTPDSDAEDSAKLDGVEGEMLPSGEKFYMGIAISRLDAKQALPFLDPNRERLLEYDLSRAVTRVMTPERPVVGIMSALPIFGAPMNPMMARMGQQQGQQQPWVFVTELKSDFTVRQVEMTAEKIDDDVKVLVVVHPKEITEIAQYAIDQFVMRGGKLIAFFDAASLVDSRSQGMMGQMPGGGSSLDKLIKAWGLQFDQTKVVADMNFKAQMQGRNGQPTEAPAFLLVTKAGINPDDVATSELKDLWIPFGGAFTGTPVAGLKETVLVHTTESSQLVDGMMATLGGENIVNEFKASGNKYALAVRLAGKFKSAFPEGKPKDAKDDKKDAPKPADAKADDSLKESKGDNAVVLFGDADMLYDQFALRQNQTIFGPMGYVAANGNLILAQNLVDQFAGDSDLIRVRSRAEVSRPFTRIREMESKARESYQSKIQEFEKSLQETQARVTELQQKKEKGQQQFILSPEQQVELEKLKKQEAAVNVQLKTEKKKLVRDIDSLENSLKWSNIIGMPVLVAISGLGLAFIKRKRTSAK